MRVLALIRDDTALCASGVCENVPCPNRNECVPMALGEPERMRRGEELLKQATTFLKCDHCFDYGFGCKPEPEVPMCGPLKLNAAIETYLKGGGKDA